jgi:oligopeptide/dipeptide ABC transporter ATP-binding protein
VSDAPLVSVRGLRVRYHERRRSPARRAGTSAAANDVSFDIARRDTFALVGESGSGKTTTARALMRLIEPDAGEIRFDGIDLRALHGEALRAHRRRMQIVFQDPFASLNPRSTIGDSVSEGLRAHALAAGSGLSSRVAGALEEVGLDPTFSARYPHELSGGQRQRAAIARALVVDPEFLVLDEAVSALDVTTQSHVLDVFERLRATRGLTTLFIAHNLAVVQRVASTVAVMYRGRIVEDAPAASLFGAARHPYTRALLAAVPVPDPRVRRARVLLPDDPAGSPATTSGCPFYARCPHPARDGACRGAVPPLAAVGPGHRAACIKEAAPTVLSA